MTRGQKKGGRDNQSNGPGEATSLVSLALWAAATPRMEFKCANINMLLAAAQGNLEPQNCFFAKKSSSKCKKDCNTSHKVFFSILFDRHTIASPSPLLPNSSMPIPTPYHDSSSGTHYVSTAEKGTDRGAVFPRGAPPPPPPSTSLQKHLLSPSIHGLTTTHPSPHSPHHLSLRGGHCFELLAPRPRSTCTQGFSAHVCVLYIRVVAVDSGRASLFRAGSGGGTPLGRRRRSGGG